MADRTKDIWNDDDGELPPKRSHRLRGFLIFSLTLVAVLLIVLLAAWRDGTGFDALRRYFAYGSVESAGGERHYGYESSANNRFAALGDTLVVLSETALQVLNKDGTEQWSASVKMKTPALIQGGGRAVAYDVGGTELYVVDQTGERLALSAGESEPYIAANLNDEGWLAVTAEKKGYKGAVTVYDKNLDPVFAFNSSDRFVADARVSADGRQLAAVTLGQEDSVFVSRVVVYDLSATDPVGGYTVEDGLVLELGEVDGSWAAVADTRFALSDRRTGETAEYAYAGEYLREYDLHGDGFAVLLLNRYQSGSLGRLVTLDAAGQSLGELDVTDEVRSISAAGRYVGVLYADRLEVYNREMQVYATLSGTDPAREVLMRADGSALLLSADSAKLFLP